MGWRCMDISVSSLVIAWRSLGKEDDVLGVCKRYTNFVKPDRIQDLE